MNLEISNLTFGYSADKVVLDDISMSVASGSTVAIVGPSGCGKTTLLQIIAGILSRETGFQLGGRLTWDGATDTKDFRRRGKIGYMFQTPTLLPHLNVAENVVLPFVSTQVNQSGNHQDGAKLLERVGLSKFAHHYPDQLSVGMRARVALVRTLATEPSLLLLDEAFSSLDVGWRLTLYSQWWFEMRQRHPTTILVTHDVGEAFLLATRVFVINTKGKIARVIECVEPKPQTPDLDSIREFSHRVGRDIDEIQYQISRDVVENKQGRQE